jgi:TatD DNase family protein
LQDERLAPQLEAVLAALRQEKVAGMVVNGSTEQDWPAVTVLARRYPEVIPSFGYHPWHVKDRTAGWQQALVACLDAIPSAVGEIGLDRWMRDYDLEEQEAVFTWQLRLASERDVPASIHCLQAWERLLELLRAGPVPRCGFVLHSFGGPREMIGPLAELGAFFSLPGYFAHESKSRQRQAFRQVPPERLLVETDAPDQLLPEARVRYPLADPSSGRPINHPANLVVVYEFAAELFQEPLDTLSRRVEENFLKLFGRLRSPGGP